MRELDERYIVRYGKFGAYFYDLQNRKEMTLKDVEKELNFLHTCLKDKGTVTD